MCAHARRAQRCSHTCCLAQPCRPPHRCRPPASPPRPQLWPHIVLMAYAMVLINATVLAPFILFVLGFSSRGWNWLQGAVLAAMLAPTDAVAGAACGVMAGASARCHATCLPGQAPPQARCPPAPRRPTRPAPPCCAVTAILKAGGGPEGMVVIMEGEALLNDASAVTLYTGGPGEGAGWGGPARAACVWGGWGWGGARVLAPSAAAALRPHPPSRLPLAA